MLARYYGVQGDFPRELRHLSLFFSKDPKDQTLLCLAWHEKAKALSSLGKKEGRKEAIDEYGRYYSQELGVSAGLESPRIMELWRTIDSGDPNASDHLLSLIEASEEAKTDPSFGAALGLAQAEMEFRSHRDTKKAKDVLLGLMDSGRLGPEKFLSDPGLLVAAVVCEERLFQPKEAIGLIDAAKGNTTGPSAVVPEAELARNELLLCHWNEAAADLAKAQKIVRTYPVWIRTEAVKNLDFAVADYCLATGHPAEALEILHRLESDFLRPGFSTESTDYFLGGLHLRLEMASDRLLRLELACLRHSPPRAMVRGFTDVAGLAWQRWKSGLLFREALFSTIRTAYPGTDIGTLIFAPAWMLPEMKRVLGREAFDSLAAGFAPEGRRKEILGPMIKGRGVPKEDTPPLIRAVILACQNEASECLEGWSVSPSAPLIAGRALPVSLTPGGLPFTGWLDRDPLGISLSIEKSEKDHAELLVRNGEQEKRLSLEWPVSVSGKIEKLCQTLLNPDPAWNVDRVMMLEGRTSTEPLP